MTTHQSEPRPALIGLETHGDRFYIYGDAARRDVRPHPVGPPRVIEGMPLGTPYSAQVERLTLKAPAGANAFVLGPPLPSLADPECEYALVVQYCVIPDEDARGAAAVSNVEWAITGFAYKDGRLGWIKKEAVGA